MIKNRYLYRILRFAAMKQVTKNWLKLYVSTCKCMLTLAFLQLSVKKE